jgi:hypothetical protein
MSELSEILKHQGFVLTGLTLTQLSRHSHLQRKIAFGNTQIREFMGRKEFFRMGRIVFTYSNLGVAVSSFTTGLAIAGGLNGLSDTTLARPVIQLGRVIVQDISVTEFSNSIVFNSTYTEEILRHTQRKNEMHMELLRKNPVKYYGQREPHVEIIEFDAVFEKR